ncbi:MAG TPA: thiamine pyrophosphate-dependent enzyme [Methanotrichaceae archaeon]|nr:thiamine pyrophosphate-dependent enzyme [Methanotrichaceae archaeon]HQF15756.1 thiamine pyrophosphate-dependent enzyme [Methanotrichaceae archaeon]HQI90571.1 thiamine pyrophosphate-dependent enzyme [Methanotrichaceae archaeon]
MKVEAKEAIAAAMSAAGSEVGTCVPGLGATEIFCDYCALKSQRPVFSFHEEVAYTIAHGAALAGKRAFTCHKAHGFFKAANSVSDSLYSGVVAGFVSVVVDDKNGIQSDSIADAPGFAKGLGIPHKIANVETAFNDVLDGFALSEELQLPFALIIDASELGQPSHISEARPNLLLKQYSRDITQHVLCPPFCRYQRDVLQSKLSGSSWKRTARPSLPTLSEALPERWRRVADKYAVVFETLRSAKGKIVAGDTGLSTLFALPPFDCIDVTTYMGGSIPLALGAYMAGVSPAWAVSGDFSFIAAGNLGLVEAVQRHIPLKVLLLYNGKAETTGGQTIPDGLMERILLGYKEYVYFIDDPLDRDEVKSAIKEASISQELSLVVADFRDCEKKARASAAEQYRDGPKPTSA